MNSGATDRAAAEAASRSPLAGWLVMDRRARGLSALACPAPVHANALAYTLRGISFVGFLVRAATGFWLIQFELVLGIVALAAIVGLTALVVLTPVEHHLE